MARQETYNSARTLNSCLKFLPFVSCSTLWKSPWCFMLCRGNEGHTRVCQAAIWIHEWVHGTHWVWARKAAKTWGNAQKRGM